MVTLQQIFNAAWQAFIVEGKPPAVRKLPNSTIPKIQYACCYLNEQGGKCAIGLCIPDGHPAQQSKSMFGFLTQDHPSLFDEAINNMGLSDRSDFQRRLHDAHVDTSTGQWNNTPAERLAAYEAVAKDFGLTIPKITLQSIFNAAWQAFIVEDQPPAVQNGSCCYLTPDGRKCAVGLCLPNGHPAQDEGVTVCIVADAYPDLFDFASNIHAAEFQLSIHDQLVDWERETWKYTLDERREKYLQVAKDYGLEVPVESLSSKIFWFVAKLEAIVPKCGGTGVHMMQGDIMPKCGTPGCHGGWAALALGTEATDFIDGANALAQFLGFETERYLERWAMDNPRIWGNHDGIAMFCDGDAFNQESNCFDVSVIIDHWRAVGQRAKEAGL